MSVDGSVDGLDVESLLKSTQTVRHQVYEPDLKYERAGWTARPPTLTLDANRIQLIVYCSYSYISNISVAGSTTGYRALRALRWVSVFCFSNIKYK